MVHDDDYSLFSYNMNLTKELARSAKAKVDPYLQQTTLGPDWRAPPGPRSGRVAKQRELAKRVVAKQQVCAADRGRAAQSVATQHVQAVDCGRVFSSTWARRSIHCTLRSRTPGGSVDLR